MQVGPAITPSPGTPLTLDLKEYASKPLTFIQRHLTNHGHEITREFIERAIIYPFITDLFGEWLARNNDPSPGAASQVLLRITREVIASMTLHELCEMLQKPLQLLANEHGSVSPRMVGPLLRELALSALAKKVEDHLAPFKPEKLERILSTRPAETPAKPVEPIAASYSDFVTELKEAGVVLPPSGKDRQTLPPTKAPNEEKPSRPRAATKRAAAKAKLAEANTQSLFDPDTRTKIMTEIFRDDEDDFNRSMELLNKAKDWKQASIYLDALFIRRKVDPYSNAAIRLTDAVYARFHSHR